MHFLRKIYRHTIGSNKLELLPKKSLDSKEINRVAKGYQPLFTMKPKLGSIHKGWYMLELGIEAHKKNIFTKVNINYGYDCSERQPCNFPLKSHIVNKRLFFFEKQPLSLELVCKNQTESINIKYMRLVKVTSGFAANRMARKMVLRHPDFQNKKPRSLFKGVVLGRRRQERLMQLLGRYEECFNIFLQNERFDYESWRKKFEDYDAVSIASEICLFRKKPKIAVVVPLHNTPERLLRECIESVLGQSYGELELCLADDASTEPHVRKVIEEFAVRDNRVRIVLRKKNGHISNASNSALKAVTSDYVAFLDHDDMLHEHALYFIAKALNDKPDLDIIYTDEDFIDKDGRRHTPHFKSDWNPFLLYSHNYITHLCSYRRSLIEQAGGFREGVEGAQDYDLVLRCSALTNPEKIHHIPRILYHWRAIEGSTAFSSDQKSYTVESGRKALQDYFDSHGIKTFIKPDLRDNFYRVEFCENPDTQLVTLIIPTRDNVDLLSKNIYSILKKTGYNNYEIIIVDNQSHSPGTFRFFEEITDRDNIRVVTYNKSFNYAAINNFAIKYAKGDIICLVNNDIEVISGNWLGEMASIASRPEVGCVGAKLYYPDNTIQHAGVILGLGGYAAHAHRGLPGNHPGYFNRANVRQNLSAVTGACLMVRKKIFEQVGGLDERLQIAYNDVDFCLKVRKAGYFNVFTPFAQLYHHESRTRGYDNTPEKMVRFQMEKNYLRQKWGELLDNDPYYNPNLTREREDFSIRNQASL